MAKTNLFRRLRRFLRTGKASTGDHHAILEAFIRSQGSAISEADQLVRDQSDVSTLLSDWPEQFSLNSEEIDLASKNLQEEGVHVFDTGLSPATVSHLQTVLSSGAMKLVSDDPNVSGRREPLDYNKPLAEKYDVPVSNFMGDKTVQALMLNSGILQVAHRYLRSTPIVDIAAAWHSFPVGRSSNEAATQFHFDLDRLRWVKVFFFLTDFSRETGSHLFVKGSHRDGGIPQEILKKGYTRIADETVAKFFPQDSWFIPEGTAGKVMMEDTRGLHKGLPLLRGHRLVLQFQFTSSLFGGPTNVQDIQFKPGDRFMEIGSKNPNVVKAFSGVATSCSSA